MKSTILSLLFLLSFVFQSFAQSPNAARAVKMAQKMSKQVQLNDEQLAEVSNAYRLMYDKLDAAKTKLRKEKSEKPKSDTMPQEMQQIKDDFNQSIAKILSDEQAAKWEAYKAQRAKRAAENKEKEKKFLQEKIEKVAARKADKLAKQLNLTLEQQQAVYEAQLQHMKTSHELRLTAIHDPMLAKDERKNMDAQLDKNIIAILNDEQKQSFKNLQAQQRLRKEKIKKQHLQNTNKKKSKYVPSDAITEKAESQTKRMKARYKLTPEQTKAYRKACIQKFKNLEQLNKAYGDKMTPAKKDKLMQILQSFDTKVNKILTKEQLQKQQLGEPKRG